MFFGPLKNPQGGNKALFRFKRELVAFLVPNNAQRCTAFITLWNVLDWPFHAPERSLAVHEEDDVAADVLLKGSLVVLIWKGYNKGPRPLFSQRRASKLGRKALKSSLNASL
jgi:hypothetical protein